MFFDPLYLQKVAIMTLF